MFIKKLMLINYRNYEKLNINFGKGVNVFIGDNAQGKTNILESIYYCAFAKSHRTTRDRELINWNNHEAYISLGIAKERLDKKIDIKNQHQASICDTYLSGITFLLCRTAAP